MHLTPARATEEGAGSGRWGTALTAFSPVAVATTLVCCALPITLVSLGLGSTMAVLISVAPWLVTISRYKIWFFLGTGLVLALTYWMLYRSARLRCVPDAQCAPANPLGRWARRVFWASVALYLVGVGTAYTPLVRWLDSL